MPTAPSSASIARIALAAALIGVAACKVEYRPGSVRTDTAQGDAAVASAPQPATSAVPPSPPVPAQGSAPAATDTLEGTGTAEAAAPSRARTFPRTAEDSSPSVGPGDIDVLRARSPIVPVSGVAASALRDNFADPRGGGARSHEALDIMAARNTPVLAADDGRVTKLFLSKAGGLTIYVASPDGRYMYYYAHLDHYRDGLTEGTSVRKGDTIAFVGSTGDASPEAPHLHFAIARVADPSWWWTGTPLNPFLVLKP